MNLRPRVSDEDSLHSRLGGALAARLSLQAQSLPHEITERLRAGREQALARARFAPATVVAAAKSRTIIGRSSSGAAMLGLQPSWPVKLASGLPLLVLLGGLLMIEHLNGQQQVRAAAEIDTMLLADTLPTAAYTDPGFGEFLRSSSVDQP